MGDGRHEIAVSREGGWTPAGGKGFGEVGGVSMEVIRIATDALPSPLSLSGKGIRDRVLG